MLDRRYRILAIATHPVQYTAPVFRHMAKHPLLDLQVAYCTLRGAEASHDTEFGASFQWDVPLLDGYSWTHVQNRGSQARIGVRVASADARGDADFADDSREYAAALRVGGPLLMFNCGPF